MTVYAEREYIGVDWGWQVGSKLHGLRRCPYCSVATPNMNRVWSDTPNGESEEVWAAYRCENCNSVTICVGDLSKSYFTVDNFYPKTKKAHEDIPEVARKYLQQAYETLHAPDAAAVMAGSAVDAMLKACGLGEGSLYSRIDKALDQGILTQGMANWAHEVRLGSNRPRHADADKPHVSEEEAKRSVDFAEALGNFLFVLTARIERGITAAKAAEAN